MHLGSTGGIPPVTTLNRHSNLTVPPPRCRQRPLRSTGVRGVLTSRTWQQNRASYLHDLTSDTLLEPSRFIRTIVDFHIRPPPLPLLFRVEMLLWLVRTSTRSASHGNRRPSSDIMEVLYELLSRLAMCSLRELYRVPHTLSICCHRHRTAIRIKSISNETLVRPFLSAATTRAKAISSKWLTGVRPDRSHSRSISLPHTQQ